MSACVVSLAGATWLTLGMSFYEGQWCNTGLMMYSWIIYCLIFIINVGIIILEVMTYIQDLKEDEGDENDDNLQWLSVGFATSAILFISSFILNIVNIYKCVGDFRSNSMGGSTRSMRGRRGKREYFNEGFVARRPKGRNLRARYSYSEDDRSHNIPRMHIVPKRSRSQKRSSNQSRQMNSRRLPRRIGNRFFVSTGDGRVEKNSIIEITAGEHSV